MIPAESFVTIKVCMPMPLCGLFRVSFGCMVAYKVMYGTQQYSAFFMYVFYWISLVFSAAFGPKIC